MARYLKEKNPKIKTLMPDPVGSVFYEYFKTKNASVHGSCTYQVEGIGEDHLVKAIDFSVIDDVIQFTDRDAFLTARRLAREEGILAGGSSGANVWGALKLAENLQGPATIVTVLPDQYSKYWVIHHFPILMMRRILPMINIFHTHNTGAAFSFLGEAGGWQRWLLIAIAFIINIAILIWLTRLSSKQWLAACGLSLILGGAAGNLWDRLTYGFVVDFIDLHIGSLHFPAYFNIGDVAINVGLVLWLIDTLRNKNPPR